MQPSPQDLADIRLSNALTLFEEFVRATARHADAATLRGLERRFAERLQIQPSYWSQVKARNRQIGERLARQFETLCHKPAGWMDQSHSSVAASATNAGNLPPAASAGSGQGLGLGNAPAVGSNQDDSQPRDADERFILGLVLTYYRRHPQRARTRLLGLLGEVLTDPAAQQQQPHHQQQPPSQTPGPPKRTKPTPLAAAAEDAHGLWLKSQSGVAPLKRKG